MRFYTFFKKMCSFAPLQYVLLVLLAVVAAFSYEIFVYPNDFAPSGVAGISTMVQYLFHISAGYLTFLINLPMLIVAFFVLNRKYAVRNFVYLSAFSIASVILRHVDLSAIAFRTQDVGGAILAAVAGGFIYGFIYGMTVKLGASTGGTDIIAAFVNKKYPEMDTIWVIFLLNVAVAILSFFVYGFNYAAVILCIVNSYAHSRIGDLLIKGSQSAAKFEVITVYPEELSKDLIDSLHHGCTVLPAKGMYSGEEKYMLICVVNRRQIVDFERVIAKYDNTFAYLTPVNKTIGIFHRVK